MCRKKIAVIGGGLSSITAIYYLSQLPDFEEKYEITLYQMGWRLGGKGASGINQKIGFRIEEHGLHLWMGFYENAFCMMRDIYAKLNRPPDSPLSTFEDAFKGQPFMIFEEYVDGEWIDWKIHFPKLPGKVGDGRAVGWKELLDGARDFLLHEFGVHQKLHSTKDKKHRLIRLFLKAIDRLFGKTDLNANSEVKEVIHSVFSSLESINYQDREHHIDRLQHLKHIIWDLLGHMVERSNPLRRLWVVIDLLTTILSGMIKDGVLEFENELKLDFTRINTYDYAEWLKKHGADPGLTIPSPMVKSMYDGPFAFKHGDITQANAEAGTMLNIFLRMAFTCKENVIWRMQAGMGDTIFAPAYQWLQQFDNIHFEFFHKATDIKLSEDKKCVQHIVFEKQVELKDQNLAYQPLVRVNGLDCWPSEPLYDQINPEQAQLLIEKNINLESSWSTWDKSTSKVISLHKDFDELIIGASLASLPHFASELVDNNCAIQNMLQHIGTVQTQAFQLWFNKDYVALGIDEDLLLSCYVEPLDTFAAMNQLLSRENWPGQAAKYIAYVCGAFPDAANILPYKNNSFPSMQKDQVKHNMINYIQQHLKHIVPKAFKTNKFDWNILVDLNESKGEKRADAQYYRANVDPSERYVLSLKDTSRYRLKTNETGFDRVFFTGDWIQNGLNAGFVEGAVVSGILTARALSNNYTIPLYLPKWDKQILS